MQNYNHSKLPQPASHRHRQRKRQLLHAPLEPLQHVEVAQVTPRVFRRVPLALACAAALGLSTQVQADCKTPQQWLTGTSSYVSLSRLILPDMDSLSRTPSAGYSINWVGRNGGTGQRGQDMPRAWMDHYCEANPPVPAGQNLQVFIQGGNGGNAEEGGGFTDGPGKPGGYGGNGGDIFLGVLEDNGRISTSNNAVSALSAISRGGTGGKGGKPGFLIQRLVVVDKAAMAARFPCSTPVA